MCHNSPVKKKNDGFLVIIALRQFHESNFMTKYIEKPQCAWRIETLHILDRCCPVPLMSKNQDRFSRGLKCSLATFAFPVKCICDITSTESAELACTGSDPSDNGS